MACCPVIPVISLRCASVSAVIHTGDPTVPETGMVAPGPVPLAFVAYT